MSDFKLVTISEIIQVILTLGDNNIIKTISLSLSYNNLVLKIFVNGIKMSVKKMF
jgi:hypothetical protein